MCNTSFLNIERDHVLIRLIKKRIEGSPVYDLQTEPFQRQLRKMIKHTQIIFWEIANELFECV